MARLFGPNNERRGMTISVIILGCALIITFLAYFSFGNKHDNVDIDSVKFVAIVSLVDLLSSTL